MTINEAIIAAVETVVPVCVPGVYRGKEKEYCTFNYSEHPDMAADDWPLAMKYLVQVHYCCPAEKNPLAVKRAICRALAGAGFTYPSVVDASDEDGQHFVLECEWTDGDL